MGMGKLGSFELTAGSDVDLVLLYEQDDSVAESLGPKPLDPQRYYTRMTQRLIAALSAPTAEGVLFEVDMRLRPSGNKGPLATRLGAFRKYQREEAWTWEHMALTRARMICGDESLMDEASHVVHEVLSAVRDPGKTADDVREMRALIEKEKPPHDSWDFKLIPGGLVDLEFIAQYLQLVASRDGSAAELSGATTLRVLEHVGASSLSHDDLGVCLQALRLFTELSQIIRLCVEGPFDPKDAPAGLVERICRAADCPDLPTVQGEIKRLSKSVRSILDRTLRSAASPG
jgi:glutamate-ammonia-ligase adenylyltransferase